MELAAAFDAEFNKAITSLPRHNGAPPSQHDAHLVHYRATCRLAELVSHYAPRLPPHYGVPRILAKGEQLLRLQEHRLARDEFFHRVRGMALHQATDTDGSRLDAQACLAAHVQAAFGCAVCSAALFREQDRAFCHADTIGGLEVCLQELQDAMALVMPQEALYWLVLNGSVHIYAICQHLIIAGFAAQVLPRLLFCARALEAHVLFHTARWLPWRSQLYVALTHCYGDLGAWNQGSALLQTAISRVDTMLKLQKLDPVPTMPAVVAAFRNARTTLCALKLKLEALGGASGAVLQPLLAEVPSSGAARLTTLLEALQVPGRRVLQHHTPTASGKELFDLAKQAAAPLLAATRGALVAAAAAEAAEQGGEALAAGSLGENVPLAGAALGEGMPLTLHKAYLSVAFSLEQWADFDDALKVAAERLAAPGALEGKDAEAAQALDAVSRLLETVRQLEQQPGAESLTRSAGVLQAVHIEAGRHIADMLTDAMLVLYAAARPLLDGVYCWQDKEAKLVTNILRSLHAVCETVDLSDGLLRLGAAAKLALLLEEQSELYEAREVAQQGVAAAQKLRCEAMKASRHAEDEPVRWITASRSQSDDAIAALISGMSDSEQELACFHTDLLVLQLRLELAVALAEQQGRAAGRRTRAAAALARRDGQSDIFGVRTMKERRLDEVELQRAGASSSSSSVRERELLTAASKNPYQRAVLMMQMAPFQAEQHKQAAMLQEAADLLVKAQASETALFATTSPAGVPARRDVPPAPRFLQRTPYSVTLTHPPLGLKGARRPATYAAYCKNFGAGVALSINKTATEYPGTGVRVPLGTPITIDGLAANETYIFGIAAFDESGEVIGGLGASSPETLMALPLPLYQCWAHLLFAAARLKQAGLAARAAGLLVGHFVVTSPPRPLWEANPMDAYCVNRIHLEAAARPLQRAFVQCMYVQVEATLSTELQLLAPAQGHETRTTYLPGQLTRLVSTKMLLMAVEVASRLGDHMLMQEGAIRAYHVLGPLLVLPHKAPILHKALASVHLALQGVSSNLAQDSLVGQEQQRQLSARLAAALSYHLVTLSDAGNELTAAALFGKLQLELLNAYDPQYSVPGRPASKALQEEARLTQEGLLMRPQAVQLAAQTLVARQKDDADLVAAVLPLLAMSATPLEAAWAVLGHEDTVENPRWVELMVRAIEAAIQKGRAERVLELAGQVTWHVRSRQQRPPNDFPAWKLAEAADTVETQVMASSQADPSDVPPPPQLEGLEGDERAAAEQRHAAANLVFSSTLQRRIAAVLLLQRRLPVLHERRRSLRVIRESAKRWAPWLARLNTLLGLTTMAEAQAHQARVRADVLVLTDGNRADPSQASPPRSGPHSPGRPGAKSPPPRSPAKGTKSPSARSPSPPASGRKSVGGAASGAAVLTASPAGGEVPGGSLGEVNGGGPSPPLQVLVYLSRAMQLAQRGEAWHELLNAARHKWNAVRVLLNADITLTEPTPRVVWEQGPMPPPPEPPASLFSAAPVAKDTGSRKGGKEVGKDAKKGSKEDAKKDAGKKPAAAGKKPVAPPAAAAAQAQQVWLARGAGPNAARCARSAVESLLTLVAQMRDGMPLYTGVIPLVSAPAGQDDRRPGTQLSVASSNFSFGSDVEANTWFQGSAVDMVWVDKVVQAGLAVLLRMQRWSAVVDIGRCWMRLSQGAFNERLLTWLLQAGPHIGVDMAPFQSAMEAVVRDKHVALDQLDKVRLLVRERLGNVSLLNQGVAHKVRKKRRLHDNASRRASTAGSVAAGSDLDRSTRPGTTEGSLVSAYTYRTASTFRTKTDQPDFLRLPSQYEAVIESLKKRGEKSAMVLAIHELGDTHAHFGNWAKAGAAWNDALDALIGPYQVIRSWRRAVDGLSQAQLLQAYGAHGLLLSGGVLLGKLARYIYFDNLQLRLEACRMAATLLSALFSSDVSHPQRRVDFASYVPRRLWDGVNLFSDPYRLNVTDLLSGVETVVSVLMDNGLALDALPVLSLWEHLASHVTRQLHTTVLCRTQRIQVLVSLGLMSEAGQVLVGLLSGSGLPDPHLDTDYIARDEDGTPLQVPSVAAMSNRHMPGDPANKATVMFIAEASLPSPLDRLYGSWAVAHLNMARAAFLMQLGGTPNDWRATDPATGLKVAARVTLPEALEPQLLAHAAALVDTALSMAADKPSAPVPAPDSPSKKAPAKAAKPDPKKKDVKKAEEAVPTSPESRTHLKPSGGSGTLGMDGAGVCESDHVRLAQRAEVMCRALLLASELELLRWQPLRALERSLDSLTQLGELADRVNRHLDDNDETERLTLSPTLWLLARVQVVRCTAQLHHADRSYAFIAAALVDAASVNDALLSTGLIAQRAAIEAAEGRTAAALATYQEVIARYQQQSVRDTRLGAALLGAALLQDRLSLRAESAALSEQALGCLGAHAQEMGLSEMKVNDGASAALLLQEHPELINIYTLGMDLYTEALAVSTTAAARKRRGRDEVESGLRAVLRMLRGGFTRPQPAQLAECVLALGRALRLAVMTAGAPNEDATSNDSVAQNVATLNEAHDLLTQAVTLAALDGGHLRHVMRAGLLEMAAIAAAAFDDEQTAAYLRLAAATAGRMDALLIGTQALTPVTVMALPDWATNYVKGQEQHFAASQGKPLDVALADSDVGRMVMCLFTSLLSALPAVHPAERQRCYAQLTALHMALRSACPKYLSDACFSDVPLPVEKQPLTLPPGTVLAQWYIQDGCWQEPMSWQATGSLPSKSGQPLSDADVLKLAPLPTYASLLYVIVPASSGPRCGDLCFPMADVRRLQAQVKEARLNIESPRAPTDMFGHDAPTAREVRRLKAAAQRFLAQRPPDDDEEDEADENVQTAIEEARAAATAVAVVAAAASGVAVTGIGGPKSRAMTSKTNKTAAASKTIAPPGVEADLPFLIRLEALLQVESGIDLVNVELAEWLDDALPT